MDFNTKPIKIELFNVTKPLKFNQGGFSKDMHKYFVTILSLESDNKFQIENLTSNTDI